MPDGNQLPGAERQKFKHTQSVATRSIAEAIDVVTQEAYSHYGSIGTDVVLDDDEPAIEIVVKVRGTYVLDEVRRENHALKAQVEAQQAALTQERARLAELQARLSPPTESSP